MNKQDEKMNRQQMEKKITLQETLEIARTGEPVTLGLPFSPGEVSSADCLVLLDERGAPVPLQVSPLAFWPDRSLKWGLLDFFAAVPSGRTVGYRVVAREGAAPPPEPAVTVREGDDFWTIDTGVAKFRLDARRFRPFAAVSTGNRELLQPGESALRLVGTDGGEWLPAVEEIRVETEGPVRTTLLVRGSFQRPGKEAPVFFSRLHFFRNRSLVKIDFTLRNPRAAHHPNGLWDLGDPGSLVFKELGLRLALAFTEDSEVILAPEMERRPFKRTGEEGFSLYQESSGGENWRSPNHRNQRGEIPLHLRGYEVLTGETAVARGWRAVPLIWVGEEGRGVSAAMSAFWQDFPKALAANRKELEIGLFPGRFPDDYELQGGEQKSHSVFIDFAAVPDALGWVREPLVPAAVPDVYRDAGIFHDMPRAGGREKTRYPSLTRGASSLAESLLDRREIIDEYGWRNFGDVYADHEAVGHQGDTPFVSHYNNQYDLVFSAYREFMTTGDPLWRRLAADLARHVIDIDIYHTPMDREEYNGGMFWHTDHYLQVGGATHRSFSREHLADKDPRYCGGGPGPEHCYTTGLAVHYFLTGDETAKEAVLNLADWSRGVLARPTTVLGVLNQAKKSLAVLRRFNGGKRKTVFPKYPLTRGTGNTINACLDAFEMTSDASYLNAVEEFIRGTVHPADQVESRNLLNAEAAWSYTVFLASLVRYLEGKLRRGEIDGAFDYGRESLLSYARWMALHEVPYLDQPETLEYPNETWAAQELRKSVVLYAAARFSSGIWRNQFLQKARFFYAAGWRELNGRETSHLTRPVALALQNSWVEGYLAEDPPVFEEASKSAKPFGRPTPSLSAPAVFVRMANDLRGAVRTTTWRRELSWLKARLR
jgi:hypothetical protein